MDPQTQPGQDPARTAPAGHEQEEPPPLFKSWERLYGAVAAYLGLLIVLFYFFTRHYHIAE